MQALASSVARLRSAVCSAGAAWLARSCTRHVSYVSAAARLRKRLAAALVMPARSASGRAGAVSCCPAECAGMAAASPMARAGAATGVLSWVTRLCAVCAPHRPGALAACACRARAVPPDRPCRSCRRSIAKRSGTGQACKSFLLVHSPFRRDDLCKCYVDIGARPSLHLLRLDHQSYR